jgi:tetratricopeptide (TPR) repeat protein
MTMGFKSVVGCGKWIVICLMGSALAAGCAGNSPKDRAAATPTTGNDSTVVARTEFELSKDPPFTAQTHFAAGQMAESQNNPIAAIDQYEKAIKLDPKHSASLYRLGIVYAQLKRYRDAVTVWKQYVNVTDASATAFSNLGFCCELAGRNDEAETAYRQGIFKDPRNGPCRVNYGLMLARHGHLDQAAVQLQTVLSPSQVHYNIGSVLEGQGLKEQAKYEFQKAIDLNPSFNDARTRMAGLN